MASETTYPQQTSINKKKWPSLKVWPTIFLCSYNTLLGVYGFMKIIFCQYWKNIRYILWFIFLWSALDFFNYVLKKMFREIEKNVEKLVLALHFFFFYFECNICTKKLNFLLSCHVIYLFFLCITIWQWGKGLSVKAKKILFHNFFFENQIAIFDQIECRNYISWKFWILKMLCSFRKDLTTLCSLTRNCVLSSRFFSHK